MPDKGVPYVFPLILQVNNYTAEPVFLSLVISNKFQSARIHLQGSNSGSINILMAYSNGTVAGNVAFNILAWRKSSLLLR